MHEFPVKYNDKTILLHEKMQRVKDYWILNCNRNLSEEIIKTILESWQKGEISLLIPQKDWDYLTKIYMA